MDHNGPSINDILPAECIDEILKKLKNRFDRTTARFVCTSWRDIVNQDSSTESYRIGLPSSGSLDDNNNNVITTPQNPVYFRDFAPLFLTFRRRKISFRLNVNLEGSESFWRQKNPETIAELYFEEKCSHQIPFFDITHNFHRLSALSMNVNRAAKDSHLTIITGLENCVARQYTNHSVRTLRVKYLNVGYLVRLAKLIDQVFIRVKTVFFDDVHDLTTGNRNAGEDVESLVAGFESLRFSIAFNSFEGRNSFVYDPEYGEFRLKIKSLYVVPNLHQPDDLNIFSSYLPRYVKSANTELQEFWYYFESFEGGRVKFVDRVILCKLPALKKLGILGNGLHNDIVFDEPVRANRIESLDFRLRGHLTINDAFLQSFANLRSLKCNQLTHKDFVKILRNLRLEVLHFQGGIMNAEERVTGAIISNHQLIDLEMSRNFLVTTTIRYDFPALKKLCLSTCLFTSMLNWAKYIPDMNVHLKRINCPKLEMLTVENRKLEMLTVENGFNNLVTTILSQFPVLVTINYEDVVEWVRSIGDETLRETLKKHPTLKKIEYGKLAHIFNRISPSHIQHQRHDPDLELPTTSILNINTP